jgi:hypothetical protein
MGQTNALTFRQVQLSDTIRRLWMEHVLWTRFFIVSTAFNLPDLEVVTERLLQNPVNFARILKPFYGEKTAMQFERRRLSTRQKSEIPRRSKSSAQSGIKTRRTLRSFFPA